MYIDRLIESEVLKGAAGKPAVTNTGPRQSGNTTMIKHIFPDKKYISLNGSGQELSLIPRHEIADQPEFQFTANLTAEGNFITVR